MVRLHERVPRWVPAVLSRAQAYPDPPAYLILLAVLAQRHPTWFPTYNRIVPRLLRDGANITETGAVYTLGFFNRDDPLEYIPNYYVGSITAIRDNLRLVCDWVPRLSDAARIEIFAALKQWIKRDDRRER